MRLFGAVFRWILSINAIWGLMIVIAFVLTVAQHFQPKQSAIDAKLWKAEGPNTMTITLYDKDDKAKSKDFELARENGKLKIPADYLKMTTGTLYLASAREIGDRTYLKWDALDATGQPAYGRFEIQVNGKHAAQGNLVTLQSLTDAALTYAKRAFELGLGLVSTMVLFLGLMKVGEEAGIVQYAAKLLSPLIRFLFPDIPKDHPANGAVLMNITTAVLGLGNASTPFGLKAMMELQNLNQHKKVASNSMVMLIAWNTAGFALLPMTLIAVRQSAGCSNPLEIIGPCMLAGATTTAIAIAAVKLYGMLPMFSIEAALAEDEDEEGKPKQDGPQPPAPAAAQSERQKEGARA